MSGVQMSEENGSRGLVSQIIHGSFVDGHGVRTTVFLKGCPLRCVWCCNPEGQERHPEIKYTSSHCNACGRCLPVCPTQAMTLDPVAEGSRARLDRKLCDNCGKCIDVCFLGALDWFGKYYTVDELFDEIKKDEAFYSASGGGVTVGGGEPTLQPAFLRRFLKKCRERYIHTALDTCLHTQSQEGIQALEEADLIICDIKSLDSGRHQKDTGLPNEVILRNLRHLSAMGKPMIVRVPLIPGYTDSPDNLRGIRDLLCSLRSVERVDLLPVHEYGRVKYDQLGKEYRLVAEPISQERQQEIKGLFEECGLKTQIGG